MPDVLTRTYIVFVATMILTLILIIPAATFVAVRFNTGPIIMLATLIPPAVGIAVGAIYLKRAPDQ